MRNFEQKTLNMISNLGSPGASPLNTPRSSAPSAAPSAATSVPSGKFANVGLTESGYALFVRGFPKRTNARVMADTLRALSGKIADACSQAGVQISKPVDCRIAGFKSGNGMIVFEKQLDMLTFMKACRERPPKAPHTGAEIKVNHPPSVRKANTEVWLIKEKLKKILGVNDEVFDWSYPQGKIWVDHAGNSDGGSLLMMKSKDDSNVFIVNEDAWDTQELKAGCRSGYTCSSLGQDAMSPGAVSTRA